MTISVKIQHTSLLEARERHGTAVRVVMRYRVIGLTDASYLALFSALDESDIPNVGSKLPGAPHLTLAERNPKLVDSDQGTVDVDLVYEPFDDEGQNIDDPPYGVLTGSVRASVQQLTTNLDKDGNTITTTHTWPSDDPDWPGRTDVQGGQVQAFIPQKTFAIQGIRKLQRPWIMANAIIGTINIGSFAGGNAHEWMCVGITWKIVDATPLANRYHMSFEFQHNPDTWNPSVVFIDPRSQLPPKDLVDGDGYKTVRVHKEASFETILGTRVQGA